MKETIYAVLALLIIAGAAWFGYQWGARDLKNVVAAAEEAKKQHDKAVEELNVRIAQNTAAYQKEKGELTARHVKQKAELEKLLLSSSAEQQRIRDQLTVVTDEKEKAALQKRLASLECLNTQVPADVVQSLNEVR